MGWPNRYQRLLIAVAFGLQVLVLVGPFQSQVSMIHDEAYVLECSSRMVRGELPYRDFATRFTPATNWLLNAVFSTVGETVVAMRLYFVLMAALLAATIQWFSFRLLPRGWSELPTLLFLCLGVQEWPIVSFHWDATIFTLLALGVLADRWRKTSPNGIRRLFLSGFLCGLAVLFLQTKGLATCLGAGLLLLLEPLSGARKARNIGVLIAGAALPGVAFLLWLSVNGILEHFFARAITFNTSRYLILHRSYLDLSPIWNEFAVLAQGWSSFGQPTLAAWWSWCWRATAFTGVDLVKFAGYYPLLALASLLAVWRRVRARTFEVSDAAFLGALLALLLASLFDFGRPNRYRLHFQAPLWNAVLIYSLYSLYRWRRWLGASLTGLVAATYLLHGLDNLLSWKAYRYPVDFPRGRLYFNDPRLASYLNQLSQSLSALVPRGSRVYAFPVQNLLVWLQGYSNPTIYLETVPVLYSQEEFVNARRQIEEGKVQWLIYSPLDPGLNGDYPNVSPQEFARDQEWARQMLTEGFTPSLQSGPMILYKRKEP